MRGASSKRFVLFGLAAFLVAFFAIWAAAQGLSDPDVPEGDVAVVEDAPGGPVTQEEFDAAIQQAAAAQGQSEVPPEDNPQYETLKQQAMNDVLLGRWVQGEAEEQGITVTDSEIDERLNQIKRQNFANEKEYQRFLRQSGFSEEDALERVRLSLLSERLQEGVLTGQEDVSEGDIEAFYEENPSQFEQPEQRDVRVILNEDAAQVEKARAALEEDDSAKNWKKVAKEFSTDNASKGQGGLREGVIEGQGDATFDEQVFGAAEGELVGPFETDEGTYLIQVVDVQEAETTPLEEASEQISQQLASVQQQAAAEEFEADFVAKWTARTFCAPDSVVERCANAPEPPSPEGAPPVQSSRPAAPGSAGSVTPGAAQGGLPQGPIAPQAEDATGLPPGAAPIGPGGAPAPGGAAPGGAPPGGAPPAGAPPTGP